MIETDESALICDFAETYHIYDYRALPVPDAATLAYGLRGDSRIRLKLGEVKEEVPCFISAAKAADCLALFVNSLREEPEECPALLTDIIYGRGQKEEKKKTSYSSGEDFRSAWAKLTKGRDSDG